MVHQYWNTAKANAKANARVSTEQRPDVHEASGQYRAVIGSLVHHAAPFHFLLVGDQFEISGRGSS